MSVGPLDDETVDKYRRAGGALRTVLDEAAAMIEPGASHLAVAEHAEKRIHELADGPAFPVNISVDEEASHATPGRDDDATFGEEMVCLDVGVHVGGYIADAAVTVDLTGTDALVAAAEAALDAAVDAVEPGAETGEVGAAIEAEIRERGYTPVLNLSGHGVGRYDAHTEPSVPNRGVDRSVEFEVGDVVAIEPFATDGRGKVGEGTTEEIYSLKDERSVRDRRAREILEEITDRYRTLPFAARWFDGARVEMALRRLKQQDVIRSYPVLKEAEGRLVSQAEHTVIVTDDGCEILTA